MKRSLLSIFFILSLLLSVFAPVNSVQAAASVPTSPDIDQDGLLNSVESSGWTNRNGLVYITDPYKADTDGDGLTDGEEKLFNTNPLDPQSPGIAVKYNDTFKTFAYYSTNDTKYLAMVQGGDRYLLTEGLVIRRGTSFVISALNDSQSSLTLTGAGLTALTPVRDPARGGWKVSIPANGTTGTYTATITKGGFSKSMKIYVIFELPADMSAADLTTFLYDEDKAHNQDEVAVFWRVQDWKYYNNESPTPTECNELTPGLCSNWQYHQSMSWAQAFNTQQYTKKVLIDYSMPAIQGRTSAHSAAQGIAAQADAAVRTNFDAAYNNFTDSVSYNYDANLPAAPYHMTGGACETNAGVFTAMLRSVGIASRPFALSYNKTVGHGEGGNFGGYEYDTAVMLWVRGPSDGSNRWYAERTFRGAEPEYQPTPSWAGGTSGMRLLENVGVFGSNQFNKFQDYYSDLIQTANAGWDFQVVTNNGNTVTGMVNTTWGAQGVPASEFAAPYNTRDLKWDSRRPWRMLYQSPYIDLLNCQLWYADGWAPIEWMDPTQSNPPGRDALKTYFMPDGALPVPSNPIENWPYNPFPYACSPSTVGTPDCTAFLNANNTKKTCTPLPGQTLGSAPLALSLPLAPSQAQEVNTAVQLGAITSEQPVDVNGDGRFDALVFEIDVTSTVEGTFNTDGVLWVGENDIRAESATVNLVPGNQKIQVSFNGKTIGDYQVNGSYLLESIWLYPADQGLTEPVAIEEMAAYNAYNTSTALYSASQFNMRAGFIADEEGVTYTAADADANGMVDTLTVAIPLRVNIPSDFQVTGELYDGSGALVGRAEWSGTDPVAALEFQIANTQPPYSLEQVRLFTGSGEVLDTRYSSILKIEDLGGVVDQSNLSLGAEAGGALLQSITPKPTNAFSIAQVDANNNGRTDSLTVTAIVDVAGQGDTYWMEGLLMDTRGIPVAWGSGSPKTLPVGTNQTLQMSFNGQQIFNYLPLTAGKSFKLVEVRIFKSGQAAPEVVVPVTNFNTPTYQRSQMEPLGLTVKFEDDMESGAGKWTAGGAWALTNAEWNSGSNTFRATGTGTLSIATTLNMTTGGGMLLQFRHAHNLGANNAEVQVSTNGSTWSTLKTYNGLTDYWTTEQVDLSAYQGASALRIRFNMTSASGGVQWMVDDVTVITSPKNIFLPAVRR